MDDSQIGLRGPGGHFNEQKFVRSMGIGDIQSQNFHQLATMISIANIKFHQTKSHEQISDHGYYSNHHSS
ncbi:hypothetical protein QJS04_geneDACA016085 [Acorus gramineus]|uniref:Uncharacterized protein n=1 Tax=Acorus gramineus TaxID=55184 RepID=A0AAV9BH17_ACOGR|nr:hypothetical protein QJS04_geneDACA016085 [Acorus gramineus]